MAGPSRIGAGVSLRLSCRPDFSQAARTYAAGVHSAYLSSLHSAQALDAAIDAFLAEPSEETLAAARAVWIVARDDYGPTEVFRFYGGPIDNEETGTEGLINAWPLDEAYIDLTARRRSLLPAGWILPRPSD